MIIGWTIQAIWNRYKKDFLALYNRELPKKIDAKDLTHRYTDKNGIAYYGFGMDMSLPVDRLGRLLSYTEMLMKGMTVQEDEAIDKAIGDALESGIKNAKEKNAAKIGSLLMEREKRRKLVIHTELLYNILAVQWIRQDEPVAEFNNDIQMQKVEQFKIEIGEGSSYFFFQVPELRQVNSFLKLSMDEWDAFWSESILQQKVLQEALKTIYSSDTGLKKSEMISTVA